MSVMSVCLLSREDNSRLEKRQSGIYEDTFKQDLTAIEKEERYRGQDIQRLRYLALLSTLSVWVQQTSTVLFQTYKLMRIQLHTDSISGKVISFLQAFSVSSFMTLLEEDQHDNCCGHSLFMWKYFLKRNA